MPGMLIRDARARLRELGFRNLTFVGVHGDLWAHATPASIEDGYRYGVRAWTGRFEFDPPLSPSARRRLAAGRLVEFVERLRGEGDG